MNFNVEIPGLPETGCLESRWTSPGPEPTNNGLIEAFNRKLRAECLNTHWFMSLADAHQKLQDWSKTLQQGPSPQRDGYNVPFAMHYHDGTL